MRDLGDTSNNQSAPAAARDGHKPRVKNRETREAAAATHVGLGGTNRRSGTLGCVGPTAGRKFVSGRLESMHHLASITTLWHRSSTSKSTRYAEKTVGLIPSYTTGNNQGNELIIILLFTSKIEAVYPVVRMLILYASHTAWLTQLPATTAIIHSITQHQPGF